MDIPKRNEGGRNGNAKLTEDEVRHIRRMIDTRKATANEIGRMYKLSTETVRRIGRRETWNWIADAPAKSDQELLSAGAESLKRFLASNPDVPIERIEADPMERIAADIKREQEKQRLGDTLIDELKGGKKDGTG